MSAAAIETRLAELSERGVEIVDPRQTYVGPEVKLERVRPGAVLYPGTRLEGAATFIGEHARVGSEGPAVIVDAALADHVEVASGYVCQAALLRGAKLGANAHVRAGTLLEEQASTAHCVGLKQTILLPFVTLGSLINFCDCLMAGGSSRKDHSEVGSGFIHFNFTPWGERGDKATASLIGDVVRGVFLREPRIFLGGVSGLVGPGKVGYGAVAGAGQVIRGDIGERRLSLVEPRVIDRPFKPGWRDRLEPRRSKNVHYVAQLFALREWYRQVRLTRLAADDPRRPPVEAAHDIVERAIAERGKQLARFIEERGGQAPSFAIDDEALPRCPWSLAPDEQRHLDWVAGLSPAQIEEGRKWLAACVAAVMTRAEFSYPDSR